MLVKCNVTKARNMFNEGIAIYLLPNKVVPNKNNMWVQPAEVKASSSKEDLQEFDKIVNMFKIYNCNSELGYRVHFYYEGSK